MDLRRGLLLYMLLGVSPVLHGQGVKAEGPHLSVRTEPQFLLRILFSESHWDTGATRTCVIIYTNHSYHLENKQFSLFRDKRLTELVSEGELTTAEQQQVAAILQDPEVASLDDSELRKKHRLIRHMRAFVAYIPRTKYQVQTAAGMGIDGKPMPPAAERIVAVLDAIQSQFLPPTPGAARNDCKEPPSKRLGD